ncbi:Aminopeptidase N-like protein [Candidatus Sulfotelmatobacter sp. SbA7]|nr:Aminopeptidase N-like protein [Candidatus Sulfotelmatobacter sp. SbA7]
MPSSFRILYFGLAAILTFAPCLMAQNSTPSAPNSDPTYQQLRNIALGSEAVSVNDFTLKRDAATFHLHSGNVCFVSAVQGKITGAVFVGDGNMILEPPLAIERSTLKLLTKENEFSEKFSQLVMRFTDNTYEEIKKAGGVATGSCDPGLLRDSQNALHHNRALRFNLDARILQDVGATSPGGLFVAFIHGQRYNDKEVFAIDPHGAPPFLFNVAPEEVELVTYDDSKMGVWAAFHLSSEYKQGTASGSQNNAFTHIERQQLDTTIEKNATLTGKATTTFVSQVNGLRVVPFSLFPTLRVQSVSAEGGQPLSFIQEGKDEDAEFFSVILPNPLAAGDPFAIVTTYSGKDAVSNEGNGNYFPIARGDWYPSGTGEAFGGFSNYEMTFRIAKGMKIAATGTLVSETTEGDHDVTVWKSEVPQTVAGFNFGNFNVQEAKITKPDYVVQSWANKEPPIWVQRMQHAAEGGNDLEVTHDQIGGRPEVTLGNMNTTLMQKKALADGEISMELYTDYFGPIPFKRLAMTQQTACNFGQSWPTLVWLPICAFFDSTVRHQLGLDFGDRGYWKTVAPHEVAHQWWGHTVGFNSYRDQWMSEGFADMSASLFLQAVDKNPKRFIDFWNDERELLTMRNPQGYRAIDAGPVTLGYRLSNSRTGGNLTRDLIYPKGAYILHMVRMMMWDKQTGDQNFKATMQDFVKTYAGRAATTEDFKAMVEKHMTPEMAAFGGGKMDWFFDEYVYGTQLPSYNMQSSIDNNAAGDMEFSFKLTQSNVDANFRMLVPLYIELADGSVRFLGRARLTGDTSMEQKIPLKGLKDKPHRLLVNYYDDVLASAN